MKLFIQRECKSVSNNSIRPNQPSICCNPFTFSIAVHSGKPKAEPTSYYTPGTSQTVKYLIQNLECYTNLVGRNIYSRLYTSIPMAQWQFERGITSVGTLQSNRKGIPAEIKENQRPRNKLMRNLLGKG